MLNIHWYLYCTVRLVIYFYDSIWSFWVEVNLFLRFYIVRLHPFCRLKPNNRFNPATLCDCPNPRPRFPSAYVGISFLVFSYLSNSKISTFNSNSLKNNMMVRLYVSIICVTCTYFPKYCVSFDICLSLTILHWRSYTIYHSKVNGQCFIVFIVDLIEWIGPRLRLWRFNIRYLVAIFTFNRALSCLPCFVISYLCILNKTAFWLSLDITAICSWIQCELFLLRRLSVFVLLPIDIKKNSEDVVFIAPRILFR